MSVTTLIEELTQHDLPRSLQIFVPELILSVGLVVLLFVRMLDLQKRLPTNAVALTASLLAFLAVFAQFMYLKVGPDSANVLTALYECCGITEAGVGTVGPYFTNLLVHDQFAVFFRLGLTLFLVLLIALTILSGIPDEEDGQDFYTLLLGATVGMLLAAGTNHLLMLFLSIEMMSVPSYVMVAFQKGRRQAGEAALKYVVYGAGAAGVMLYGISLISGLLGTAVLPEMGARVAVVLGSGSIVPPTAAVVTLMLGLLMVLCGLAFKLSLVPFHFWCPDAFEGASAEVCAFLSVASKAAAFAVLVRFVLGFEAASEATRQLGTMFGLALGVLAILSMTYGNLAAYAQDNIKRMLAYSTIAHAGYMAMAVSAMLILMNAPAGSPVQPLADASQCMEGLMYYLAVYLFMNLCAFACVALIRNETFREDISGYNGLFQGNTTTKVLCICLAISFVSLVGIPPFGGAFAKLLIFISAYKAGTVHWFLWVVLVAGGLNAVFSLFYYLRVLKAMFITPPEVERRPLEMPGMLGAYVALITVPIVVLGATPLMGDLTATAKYVADALFQ
ncbi:NADH-quinone oxidoreductase subunit N [Planctomicrobium sp. SH664]|uniref:NADH-quinone oxidoreductase subunit N n=1 Tax=Planctomicrobium sp. SH664 TaxID=3448125 RepID=UPI003F5C295A